jgi:hypothetical protein
VPDELKTLWRQPRETLAEKTKMYRVERHSALADKHSWFIMKLSDREREEMKEAVLRMVDGLPLRREKYTIDRELMYVENGRAYALNPVARAALVCYYRIGTYGVDY